MMVFAEDGVCIFRDTRATWTLAAGGDVCPIGRVEAALVNQGASGVMDDGLIRLFRTADQGIVNLEAPVCAIESPISKTGPNFRSAPGVLDGLEQAGFTLVALANNHILDQDVDGLKATFEHLDHHYIRHHGAALSHDQAALPLVFSIQGKTVSFLNMAEGEFAQSQEDGPGAARLDVQAVCRRIQHSRNEYDYVIVSCHAGNEYQPYPSPRTQQVYRDFVEAGAHLILGHHPHIPQGIEIYNDCVIVYSLGNFLFDYEGHSSKPYTEVSFVLEVVFNRTGIAELHLHPFHKNPDCSVSLLKPEARASFMSYMNTVSAPLSDTDRLRHLWEQEAISLFPGYQSIFQRAASLFSGQAAPDQTKPDQTVTKQAAPDQISTDESPEGYKTAYAFYNLFRCDAHHEALKTAFRLMYENRFLVDQHTKEHIETQINALAALAVPHKASVGARSAEGAPADKGG